MYMMITDFFQIRLLKQNDACLTFDVTQWHDDKGVVKVVEVDKKKCF